jgi:hypothetical protein
VLFQVKDHTDLDGITSCPFGYILISQLQMPKCGPKYVVFTLFFPNEDDRLESALFVLQFSLHKVISIFGY